MLAVRNAMSLKNMEKPPSLAALVLRKASKPTAAENKAPKEFEAQGEKQQNVELPHLLATADKMSLGPSDVESEDEKWKVAAAAEDVRPRRSAPPPDAEDDSPSGAKSEADAQNEEELLITALPDQVVPSECMDLLPSEGQQAQTRHHQGPAARDPHEEDQAAGKYKSEMCTPAP